jgi:hypothetical protein
MRITYIRLVCGHCMFDATVSIPPHGLNISVLTVLSHESHFVQISNAQRPMAYAELETIELESLYKSSLSQFGSLSSNALSCFATPFTTGRQIGDLTRHSDLFHHARQSSS